MRRGPAAALAIFLLVAAGCADEGERACDAQCPPSAAIELTLDPQAAPVEHVVTFVYVWPDGRSDSYRCSALLPYPFEDPPMPSAESCEAVFGSPQAEGLEFTRDLLTVRRPAAPIMQLLVERDGQALYRGELRPDRESQPGGLGCPRCRFTNVQVLLGDGLDQSRTTELDLP